MPPFSPDHIADRIEDVVTQVSAMAQEDDWTPLWVAILDALEVTTNETEILAINAMENLWKK